MDYLEIEILGNASRDYLISIGILFCSLVLWLISSRVLKTYIYSWTKRTETDLDDLIVTNILSPLTYFVPILGVVLATKRLALSEGIERWVDGAVLVLVLVVFFVVLIRFVDGLIQILARGYLNRVARRAPARLDEESASVDRIKRKATELSKMIIAAFAVLTILSNVGLNLKAVWASLGIGGIAVALAVQEPLRNLIGRIYIFSTGIFDEGHFIEFKQRTGTVKRITAFRTYVELFSDMTTVSIPNAEFITGAVTNYYGRTRFMYKWDLGVTYDVSPEIIQELIVRLRDLVMSKPEVNKDMCWIYLERLDSYSKVVRVWFQAAVPSWGESLFYGDRVLHDIQLVFESMSIPFAFPTQTVHLEQERPVAEEGSQGEAQAVLPDSDSAE